MPPGADASILDRRLVFVTGKGGVGKTSVAAALAHLGAVRGKRTLVCEMDAKGAPVSKSAMVDSLTKSPLVST